MAKNSVRDFDATAANNTDIQSVDIAENCAPSGINNAIRELMADIKDVSAGTVALESPQANSMTISDATEPSLRFLDTNAANSDFTIYSPDGSNHLRIKQQSTDRVTIKSTGEVGIGTTSPEEALHVYHPTANINAVIESGDANAYLAFKDNSTTGYAHVFLGASGNNMTFFSGGSSERMRLDSSGNVDVLQGNKIRWRYAPNSTIRGSVEVDSSDNLKFFTGSSETEQMRITSSGMQMASGKQIDTNGGRIFTQAITFSGGGTQTIDTLAASEAAIYIAQVKSYGGSDFRHGSIFYAIRTANGSPSTTTRGGYLSTQQGNSSFGISGAGVTYTAGGGNPATSIFKLRIM